MKKDIKLEVFKSKLNNKFSWYLYDNRFHCDMESNYNWDKYEDAEKHGEKMVKILLSKKTCWSNSDMDMKQPKK